MTSEISCQCLIIGAGAIGLACGAELSKKGLDVLILEKESKPLQHSTSHNSEVIHAGIYYKSGSLKAKLCTDGNQRIYSYCQSNDIDHKRLGKLIVQGNGNDFSELEKLYDNAKNNLVDGINFLDRGNIRILEPEIDASAALFSESSGIFDSHEFCLSLEAEIQKHNGNIIMDAPIIDGFQDRDSWKLEIGGRSPCLLKADLIINAAGFNSLALSRKLGVKIDQKTLFFIGHYYQYNGANPFNHLIYPLPDKYGLGIHTSLDLSGKIRFGPDAELIEEYKYIFNDSAERREDFSKSISQYFPNFDPKLMAPDFVGIRTRSEMNHHDSDFSILFDDDHGLKSLVNLTNIESPGLTSSLSIANFISKRLL
jgi:L-2-hydroxyglutarate oxidase LhgO